MRTPLEHPPPRTPGGGESRSQAPVRQCLFKTVDLSVSSGSADPTPWGVFFCRYFRSTLERT
ncbi:mCG147569 [Mus musculus]|nr:mCG147569 [Mus musculus]